MAKTPEKDRKTIEGIKGGLKAAIDQWKKDAANPEKPKIPQDIQKAAEELQKKVDTISEKYAREQQGLGNAGPPFKTTEFDILFGEGISRHGEIIDMGVEARIIEKSGAWYAYNGEKIGQGRDNAREFLRENPALSAEIENKVRESLGIPLLAGTVEAAAPEK
jgi:hypothetical protein